MHERNAHARQQAIEEVPFLAHEMCARASVHTQRTAPDGMTESWHRTVSFDPFNYSMHLNLSRAFRVSNMDVNLNISEETNFHLPDFVYDMFKKLSSILQKKCQYVWFNITTV